MDLDFEESALGLSQLEDKGLSVDLKVGGLRNLRVKSQNKIKNSSYRALKMELLPSSGSLKRSSSVANSNQKMTCSVDGCKSELGKYREYYRRHRVCENHSKDPVVIVGGEEQRFCQQCSRFHGLGEFDEEKRSCRKRLDGHNRRRRKSRPQSLYISPGPEPILGCKILQFSDPQMHAIPEPAMVYGSYEHFDLVDPLRSPNPLGSINRGENSEFNVFQMNDHERINQVTPVVSVNRRLAGVFTSLEGGRGSQKMQPNGINRSIDSYRALSLLSPLISMQPNPNTIHSNMSEPLSSTLIPDGNQVNTAGSSNTIFQACPEGFA
ncbi:hypothetical protein REPUB_Repub10bG0008800 [Reevesia pubescens]